ncbi:MAG: FAD-dependent urate hydroxylase [Actinomycetota bacterium]|nr:FAD-dependent urate hydroxylase [Actinomycetota bacterium]
MRTTDLLIVGAGPFGLALAAEAGHQGVPHHVVGRPMSFWQQQMPAGMLLRSASDWHLDVQAVATIEAFLASRGLTPAQAEPLTRELYLDYCSWFAAEKGITAEPQHVQRLDDADGSFRATLEDHSVVSARAVVLALGMGPHRRAPAELVALLPPGSWRHTCDAVDFAGARDRRYLLVGGRQSAFEWAALLAEAGARQVDVVHRHDSPAFAAADWTWVSPIVDRLATDPGWFSRLSSAEQEGFRVRLWAEGRLKVEPWLADRLPPAIVRVRPRTSLAAARLEDDGSVSVDLDDGDRVVVDEVLLATGYLPHVDDLQLLRAGTLPPLAHHDGIPDLDDGFQTSVPGLYLTSLPAAGHFGPFFGFTIGTRMSAAVITRAVLDRLAGTPAVPSPRLEPTDSQAASDS